MSPRHQHLSPSIKSPPDLSTTAGMHRSSSRKDLRAERISNSPYRRSAAKPALTKQPSWFSNLATSISASISSRFRGPRDGSVSGSDDEWSGEAPTSMNGQDVFSLAAAAGRSGDEFEQRAQDWRLNKGVLAASSSRQKSPVKSDWSRLDLSTERSVRPSPSMPALQPPPLPPASSSATLFRTPAQQVSRRNGIPASASAAALQAFVSSKGDHDYSAQDVESMEALLRSVKAESMASQPRGGWSGTLTTPLRTPGHAMSIAPSTPGSSFSIGSSAPLNRSTHRVKYLGPGMSLRRFKPTTSIRTMSSLFDDDTPGKRRKTDMPDVEVDVLEEGTSSSLSTSKSTPNLAAANKAAEFNQRAALSVAHGTQRRPSPLAQSTVASPDRPPTPRDIGRKRVNDVIKDILDNEITPNEEKPKQVFNPYEDTSVLPSGKHYSPYASLRKSSSSNHSLHRSMAASRGAAAKLDSERMKASTSSRPLSTLDMINRGKPSPSTAPTPTKKQKRPSADEAIVIDDSEDETPPPAPKAAPKVHSNVSSTPLRQTPAPVTIEDPAPVTAFPAPSLSRSTLGSASPALEPAPVPSFTATADSIVAASKPVPAPTFSTAPLGLGPAPAAFVRNPTKPAAPAPPKISDKTATYLSAKDTALIVDKNLLPFFTFTLPSSSHSQVSEAVKAVVLSKPKTDTFEFEVESSVALPASYFSPRPSSSAAFPSASSAASQSSFTIPKESTPEGTWTCNTCMLKNTADDTDKCGICDAPKPKAKPQTAAAPAAPPAATTSGPSFGGMPSQPPPPAAQSGGLDFGGSGFKMPAKPPGSWECTVCNLQNSASDTKKCHVCDAPKPTAAPKATTAAPSAAMPAAPTTGFSFSGFKAPAKADGEWECSTCMLKNPAANTEKCSICDAPKPGAQASAASKPSGPAAPPAAPTGGFTFGGKSLSASTSASGSAAPAFGGGFAAPPVAGGFTFGGKTVGGASNGSAVTPAPAFGGFGGFGVTPPSGALSFGAKAEEKDKPAMLSKPTGAAGEWTCSVCSLKNPASATSKCTICDSPKS